MLSLDAPLKLTALRILEMLFSLPALENIKIMPNLKTEQT